jgi:AcrR family transcriptional regulator
VSDSLLTVTSTRAKRHTAEERREAVLEAARAEFAVSGLHGASTDVIARRAGISQPYLFRLYGTKKELFLACVRRGFRRTLETFQQAAVGKGPDEIFEAMGEAYVDLLRSDPNLLLGQLQSYAACSDPDVRDVVRDGYGELYTYVERVSGKSEDEVRAFFATGMLINVAAAMDLPNLDAEWAVRVVGPYM